GRGIVVGVRGQDVEVGEVGGDPGDVAQLALGGVVAEAVVSVECGVEDLLAPAQLGAFEVGEAVAVAAPGLAVVGGGGRPRGRGGGGSTGGGGGRRGGG